MFSLTSNPTDKISLFIYQNVSVQLQSGQIMAICLSETEAEARRHQNEMDRVAKTREAAELLSAKEDGNDDDSVLYDKRLWGGGSKEFSSSTFLIECDFKKHQF